MDIRYPLKMLFMWLEGWFDRIFTPAWNPFYCLGALGYFYFWVVAASGLYLYIFFDTGIPQAFESVEYMTHDQWYLAGVMRSLHRYASDAMVVMMMMHLVREFAFDRYRGGRWYSWVTGVPMIWLVFAAGITGYWLVWDELAQYISIVTTEWLDWLPIFGEPIARNFMAPSHFDGRFFTLLVFLHIALPLILLFLMWFHLQRINYSKTNPTRGLAVGTMLMLLVLSLLEPAVSHPIADLTKVPVELKLDWYYLWAYPMIEVLGAGFMWWFAFAGTIFLMLIPWLPPRRRRERAVVNLENCNGCTRCYDDCPFSAIEMVARTDGASFDREAKVDSELCVSCGICAGACPTATPFRRASDLVPGIDLPEHPISLVREHTEAAAEGLSGTDRIIIFDCEHALNTGKLNLANTGSVELRCTAMLPPSFIDFVLSRDMADGVVLTGCREGQCQYRLGNDWVDGRLEGTRDPMLRKRVPRERLLKTWASPTDWRAFEREVETFREQLKALPEGDKPGGPKGGLKGLPGGRKDKPSSTEETAA
ncbi:MAG: hydrogenase iron-sulfur subunit [Rhodospirillaceae bacterium]|nr:hydrogenase iron-sulfur subunit [Rhodospirillaceae bacterium]